MKSATCALALLGCSWGSGVYAVPQIQNWQTAEGARVYFVEAPEIPMFDVRIVFAAGSARDEAIPGLARATNSLLAEGAGDHQADSFSEALGDTGAKLGVGALRDMAYIGLRSLSDPVRAAPALKLLADAVARPRFDEEAFTRIRDRMSTALDYEKQSPGDLAATAFYAKLYGSHPYATPSGGTEESLPLLSVDAVRSFHRQFYTAGNAVIAVVGALSMAEAQQIATDLSAQLVAGPPAPALPSFTPSGPQELRVPFDSIQSHIFMGQPGMRRGDPDYFPLLVGNHVLGGGSLVSVLFKEIREKRGLSYSAYSYFLPMAETGPFIASLQTDHAQEAEALQVLRETLQNFVNAGPTRAQVESAKQNLIGGFPLRIDSNREMVEQLAMLGFYRMPMDYLERFTAEISAVTPEAIADALRRRLRPDAWVTIVVGASAPE